MSEDIHTAIIERIKELSQLAESYSEAAKQINRIKALEVELKMPGAVVINRAEKEQKLRELKEQFNNLQIIHLFTREI
jgi:hypothetical protein